MDQDYLLDVLYTACGKGDVETTRHLVPDKVDVNTRDVFGRTPLHAACQCKMLDAALVLLMDLKADINPRNKFGLSPLFEACLSEHLGMVELLSQHGADANIPNREGSTPLSWVCEFDRYGVAESLVLANCGMCVVGSNSVSFMAVDVNVKDKRGMIPLQLVCHNGWLDTVQLLLNQKVDVYARNNTGHTPLMEACCRQNNHVVEYLLQQHPGLALGDPSYPLHCAAKLNSREIVGMLFDSGMDINAQDSSQSTPLHIAIQSSHYEMVELLVYHGAQVSVRDYSGNTVLHYVAMELENLDIVKFLIENGADINAVDNDSSTPLSNEYCRGDD